MSSFHIEKIFRPGTGFWPRAGACLFAGLLVCGCPRGGGGVADGTAAPGDSPAAAAPADGTAAAPEAVSLESGDGVTTPRRVRAAGVELEKHREALVAANDEMRQAWIESRGNTAEAKAARARLAKMLHGDAAYAKLDAAYNTEKKVLRGMPEKAAQKARALELEFGFKQEQ